jgi:phenylacetic acid degradation operon negative regulatory protein
MAALLRGGARAQSASSLLFVILGEFVLPPLRPAWSSELVAALTEFGFEPNAARKALLRAREAGIIEPTRDGRRVKWSITASGQQLMVTGYDRVYGWATRDRSWDGRWFALSVSIPESQRRLRHHLQKQLALAGLGSPIPGQWITPHVERGTELAHIVDELGLADRSHSFIGPIGPVGDLHNMVNSAWNLDRLRTEYDDFISTFAADNPRTDRERLVRRIQLVQAWRRFPYRDPDLPAELLPTGWPGEHAARVFHDRHEAWSAGSSRHWQALTLE